MFFVIIAELSEDRPLGMAKYCANGQKLEQNPGLLRLRVNSNWQRSRFSPE
jgi:hypothetical protein